MFSPPTDASKYILYIPSHQRYRQFRLKLLTKFSCESLPFLLFLWSAPARPTVDRSTWRALVDRSTDADLTVDDDYTDEAVEKSHVGLLIYLSIFTG